MPEGTAIVWFNGDVDHDRKITLIRLDGVSGNDGSSNLYFDSGTFAYNTATSPVVMNDTGSFYYFESDVNNEDPDFVMNGTINVVDQADTPTTTTGNITGIDTIGTLMVPTEDLESYTSDLENGGLSVLNSHNFDDIRSDDQQALIVWGASSATNSIENIASQLSELTPNLPYS